MERLWATWSDEAVVIQKQKLTLPEKTNISEKFWLKDDSFPSKISGGIPPIFMEFLGIFSSKLPPVFLFSGKFKAQLLAGKSTSQLEVIQRGLWQAPTWAPKNRWIRWKVSEKPMVEDGVYYI